MNDPYAELRRALGLQLRLTGVNMNLAPALDVNNNPHNPVINTRSFGSDPRLVSELGAAYLRGLQDSRCVAVGKHFLGHGDTNKDSHLTLPVIPYDMKRLERVELEVFASNDQAIGLYRKSWPQTSLSSQPPCIAGSGIRLSQ